MTNELKEFEVTITSKFPAYGEQESVETFYAKNANEAIKQARAMMRRNGHTRQDGPVSYQAKRKAE